MVCGFVCHYCLGNIPNPNLCSLVYEMQNNINYKLMHPFANFICLSTITTNSYL